MKWRISGGGTPSAGPHITINGCLKVLPSFQRACFCSRRLVQSGRKTTSNFGSTLRKRVLDKNQFGVSPNDAGPLWLGLRLISPSSQNAYQNVIYPKGAFVFGMLRSLFYTNKDHDKAFIEMMHDFVDAHRDRAASTESFKAIVEKHMPRGLDMENNGRMDWFFRQWVYGTEVPHYDFDYQTSAGAGGKTKVHLSLTQSQVSDNFVMLVPVFGDFGKGYMSFWSIPLGRQRYQDVRFRVCRGTQETGAERLKEILER